MISIGIPFFNAEKYLAYAIQSIIFQSYENWELILVDDGSTDNSLAIAQDFEAKDSRIRVISDGENRKLPYRLNQLITKSKGDFIARMDADDIMHPRRLQMQHDFLEKNSEFDLVATGLISIDNYNQVKGFRGFDKLYYDFGIPKLSYPIVHPSIMAKRSWFERNQYSESYQRAEDFELWTRCIINNDFKIAILPDLLLYYREEGNLSIVKIINSYNDTKKIYSKYHSKNALDKEILKLNLKILAAKIFYYTGNLQKLANRRNKKFDDVDLENYQKLLNQVVSGSAYE